MDHPVRVSKGASGGNLRRYSSDFDVERSTLSYKGRESAKQPYRIAYISMVKTMAEPEPMLLPSGGLFSYDDATKVLTSWLRSGTAKVGVYESASRDDMARLQADLEGVFEAQADAEIEPAQPLEILPAPELTGISPVVYKLINAALAGENATSFSMDRRELERRLSPNTWRSKSRATTFPRTSRHTRC
ncbi:hypothetical protein BRCH_02135 [Candidatus Burkholderia brachyanthoides]|nr:hypothetical protein BRCH_02135 [Candidatus Burkholderia brachyanthoides]